MFEYKITKYNNFAIFFFWEKARVWSFAVAVVLSCYENQSAAGETGGT